MASDGQPASNKVTVREQLAISCNHYGTRAIIELSGELDMNASGRLTDEIQEMLPDDVTSLEIDAARVTFTDSSGLRAVLWARTEAQARGAEFQVTAVSPSVERVIDLAGLRDVLLGR